MALWAKSWRPIGGESIELGVPPVGVDLRVPRRHELLVGPRQIGAAVREGDDERRVAAMDAQPVHQPTAGRLAGTAATRLPERINAVAASISDRKSTRLNSSH